MFHPVGTGPYVFDRWDRGDRITVTANREYWGQKPGFDKIIFRWISEPSTKIAALETGEVDLVSSFPTTYADRVKVNKNLALRQIPGLRGHGLAFDGRKPPFSDKRVRQALNYAVDKDSIIQHLYGGYASRLGGQLLTPAYAGWNPGLKDYPYDLEKAKKLLKEAGYPNGFEVKLDFPVGRFPQVEEVCQSVAGQLARAGVKAKLNALEFGTYLKAITSGNHSELYYLGFDGEPEGWEHVHYFSKRGNILPPIYLNEEFAELLDKVATNPDFEQRKLLMRKALEIAQEDPFLLYLVAPENLSAHSKKLKNWKPNPAQTIYLAGVELED
jgi:peptide/nickel transport system substrate-binding protein